MAEAPDLYRQPPVFVPRRAWVSLIVPLAFACAAFLIGFVEGNLLIIVATAVLFVVFTARGFFVGIEIAGPELRRRKFYSGRETLAFRLDAVTRAQWEWMTAGRFRPEPVLSLMTHDGRTFRLVHSQCDLDRAIRTLYPWLARPNVNMDDETRQQVDSRVLPG